MLNAAEVKNLTYVYDFFMSSETKGWDRLDDYLVVTEWIDDTQIFKECDILYGYHKGKKMGCPYQHGPGATCFVKFILEAVESIVELYKKTEYLHPNNRYILCYYLALSQDGQVCEIDDH